MMNSTLRPIVWIAELVIPIMFMIWAFASDKTIPGSTFLYLLMAGASVVIWFVAQFKEDFDAQTVAMKRIGILIGLMLLLTLIVLLFGTAPAGFATPRWGSGDTSVTTTTPPVTTTFEEPMTTPTATTTTTTKPTTTTTPKPTTTTPKPTTTTSRPPPFPTPTTTPPAPPFPTATTQQLPPPVVTSSRPPPFPVESGTVPVPA